MAVPDQLTVIWSVASAVLPPASVAADYDRAVYAACRNRTLRPTLRNVSICPGRVCGGPGRERLADRESPYVLRAITGDRKQRGRSPNFAHRIRNPYAALLPLSDSKTPGTLTLR